MTPLASPIFAALFGFLCVTTLFALHHLRVRPARLLTATLFFWDIAHRPQSARALWSRKMTHWKTFALLCAIVLSLAAALTAGRWFTSVHESQDVFVIDAGEATGVTDATGRTLLSRLLEMAASDLSAAGHTPFVVLAADRPEVLSQADVPLVVAARRLITVSPRRGASESLSALLLAGALGGDQPGHIHWYTTCPVPPAGLPEDIARRVVSHPFTAPVAAAIAGVTFMPDADESSTGALTIRIAGNVSLNLQLDLIDAAASPATRVVSLNGDSASFAFEHIVADGRDVELRLRNAPGVSAMHELKYRLPDRRPLSFRFDRDVPLPLRLALLSIGSEAPDGAIFVAHQGATIPSNARAAVLWTDQGTPVEPGQPLRLITDSDRQRGIDLEHAASGAGPALAGAGQPLIAAGNNTLAAIDRSGTRPTLTVSVAIVGPGADFPRHAGFPLWIARWCDDLVGRSPAPWTLAATRLAQDPLWTGPSDIPSNDILPVADLPTRSATASAASTSIPTQKVVPWVGMLLAVAMGLFLLEALLQALRRIV
jgi:hypothetical protein